MGLAIAARLSAMESNIFILEKHSDFGQETSSRNSEVIHSGIYYPTGSLKAKLCVRGKELLYSLCEENNISHKKCGKLIVATSEEELEELDRLHRQAEQNGVYDLQRLQHDEIKKLEPNIFAIEALLSPSTGIIDSHALMKYYETVCRANDVNFAYKTEVKGIQFNDGHYEISTSDINASDYVFTSDIVINCAGLASNNIARLVGIEEPRYTIYFCKGDYFYVKPPKNRLVERLIYPVPSKKLVGLGIHSTVDMAGALKLGPDATYLDENIYDFKVDPSKNTHFYNAVKRFLPFVELEDLQPDYAGIRPKVQAPGDPVRDFIIENEAGRGFPNFINCIGIESPGLTASPAIAELVEELIIQNSM